MALESIKAGDIMTSPVYTVGPEDLVRRVVALLCVHRISGVPVVSEKGLLLGLISERDILKAMLPAAARRSGAKVPVARGRDCRDVRELRARDLMVTEVVTAPSDAEPLLLASLMALRKIRRIPIVDDRKKLLGIVSHGDVYRAIFESHPQPLTRPAGTRARKPGKSKKEKR